jgi:hypothetical protein
MIDQNCRYCHGLGWIFENHPTLAWTDEITGCQCGAGMPCECQGELDEADEPVVIEIVCEGNPALRTELLYEAVASFQNERPSKGAAREST